MRWVRTRTSALASITLKASVFQAFPKRKPGGIMSSLMMNCEVG